MKLIQHLLFGIFLLVAQVQGQELLNFSTNDYNSKWKQIDKLIDEKGLPRTALIKLDELYEVVSDSNNPAQVYKCIIYKQKLMSSISEEGSSSLIPFLESELVKSQFPVSALLSSVLADCYVDYLQRNNWDIINRELIRDKSSNYEFWSLSQFNKRILELLLASVKDDRLQKIDLSQIKSILKKGENYKNYEHSLYDVLASRALGHFQNQWITMDRVEALQVMSDPNLFSVDPTQFKEAIDRLEDKKQYPYWMGQTYIEFEEYNRTNGYSAALRSIQLKRLKFVNNHYTGPSKELNLLKALQELKNSSIHNESYSEVCFELGLYYHNRTIGRRINPKSSSELIQEDRKQYVENILRAKAYWEEGIEKYPSSYGATLCKKNLIEIERPSLSVAMESKLIPRQPFLLQVNYRNFSSLDLYLYKLSFEAWRKVNRLSYDEKMKYFSKIKPIRKNQIKLREYSDFSYHKLEIDQDGLDEGVYVMSLGPLTSGQRYFSEFVVSNMHLTEFTGLQDGKRRIQVFNRTTGEPLTGVDIRISRYANRKRIVEDVDSVYKVDKDGMVEFELKAPGRYVADAMLNSDTLFDSFSWYSHPNPPKQIKEELQSLLFTDRSIYRPGQTVYFKSILFEKGKLENALVKPNTPFEISFYDSKWKELGSLNLETNEFGSVNGHFVIPSDALNGHFHIKTSLGTARVKIMVESYKRPSFELTLEKPEGNITLGDTVVLNGHANTYSGVPLVNADLSYSVYYRYQPFYFWKGSRSLDYRAPWGRDIFMEGGLSKVDESGEFSISIQDLDIIPKHLRNSHIFQFTVHIKGTDISGESQEIDQSFFLSEKEMVLSLEGEGEYLLDEKILLDITVQNTNGLALFKDVDLAIFKLEAPKENYLQKLWENTDLPMIPESDYRKKFPDYDYDILSSNERLERKELIQKKGYKNISKASFTLDSKELGAGIYVCELSGRDTKNRKVTKTKRITIFPKRQNIETLVQRIIIHTNKKQYKVGEMASISALFPNDDGIYSILIQCGEEVILEDRVKGKNVWGKHLKIEKRFRGNIYVRVQSIYKNRLFTATKVIEVPWLEKELQVEWLSFRNKLEPGEKEKWTLKIKNHSGKVIPAELSLSLYDASLETFEKHNWLSYRYPLNRQVYGWANTRFGLASSSRYFSIPPVKSKSVFPSELKLFKLIQRHRHSLDQIVLMDGTEMMPEMASKSFISSTAPIPKPKPRSNFAETVFFYSDVQTTTDGIAEIDFTMTDAITRYKLLGYAHDRSMNQVLFEKELVVQKELMIQLYTPRFLRQGDKLNLKAKLMNNSSERQEVTMRLEFYNALTDEPVSWTSFVNHKVNLGENEVISRDWTVQVPKNLAYPVKYRVYAIGDRHTDAEENTLAVLPNRMLVKESLAISLKANESKEVVFRSFKDNKSKTLVHSSFKIETTANPIWYAIQSLPYLINQKHDSSDGLFSKYFANTLAKKIVEDNPLIRTAFNTWRNTDGGLKSALQKNEDLKDLLLKQTPWVLEAQSQEVQLQNLALFFDNNQINRETQSALGKLEDMQLPTGAFPWFKGGYESRYITQNILTGFAHMEAMGLMNEQAQRIVDKAVGYMDLQMISEYVRIEEKGDLDKLELPSSFQLYYLYSRSFFSNLDIKNENSQKVYAYFLGKAEKFWAKGSLFQKGLIGHALFQNENKITLEIMNSLKESAVWSEEMGVYWNENNNGFRWDQRRLETHALIMSLFQKVMPGDPFHDELGIWLLQNRRSQHWDNTKSTAWAIYVLLSNTDKSTLLGKNVEVKVSGVKVEGSKLMGGLGKLEQVYVGEEVKSSYADINLSNNNNHISFASIYWHYFEDIDKVKGFEEGSLRITKGLFTKEAGSYEWIPVSERNHLRLGDEVLVRVEVSTERDLDYVHLKDSRASGLEPLGLRSGHFWDGGVNYFRSVDDNDVHLFFDHLPKGRHIIEYQLIVSHAGDFSNGICKIQSLYAPEFSGHTNGGRITIIP